MIEVEIKLAIGPAAPETRRIVEMGAVLAHPREFEDNILLDRLDSPLRERGAILRVRRYGSGGRLCYKEPAGGPPGYKVREEIETEVHDTDRLIEILEATGFRRIWRYTKYRAVLRLGNLDILVDETPMGNFLELEGPRDEIDRFATRLGRSSSDYIDLNYRSLYEAWCRERGIPSGDLLFETGKPS